MTLVIIKWFFVSTFVNRHYIHSFPFLRDFSYVMFLSAGKHRLIINDIQIIRNRRFMGMKWVRNTFLYCTTVEPSILHVYLSQEPQWKWLFSKGRQWPCGDSVEVVSPMFEFESRQNLAIFQAIFEWPKKPTCCYSTLSLIVSALGTSGVSMNLHRCHLKNTARQGWIAECRFLRPLDDSLKNGQVPVGF